MARSGKPPAPLRLANFPEVPMEALQIAFWKLTHGEAVYGKPGVGCDGPYEMRRMVIEVQPEVKARKAFEEIDREDLVRGKS
jgi:hypothetical protein